MFIQGQRYMQEDWDGNFQDEDSADMWRKVCLNGVFFC